MGVRPDHNERQRAAREPRKGPGHRPPWRLVVPDFELDLGVWDNLEFDVDGAYALEGPSDGRFAFERAAPDSLWLSAKLGLLDLRDATADAAWALGVQLGPKLPTASGSHGIGVESLVLLSHRRQRTQVVFNAGAFVEPVDDGQRATGIETGLDLHQNLDSRGRLSLTAELSSVLFFSRGDAQLVATCGVASEPAPWLELSLVALGGLFGGSDRYGLLLGVSPHFALW